jgi:hypothetical protein
LSTQEGAEKLATHPTGTPHAGLPTVQFSEVAAQQLQHFLLSECIAALLLQTVDTMTESEEAVLGGGDTSSNISKCITIIRHDATLISSDRAAR